jgi:hypothetical protein
MTLKPHVNQEAVEWLSLTWENAESEALAVMLEAQNTGEINPKDDDEVESFFISELRSAYRYEMYGSAPVSQTCRRMFEVLPPECVPYRDMCDCRMAITHRGTLPPISDAEFNHFVVWGYIHPCGAKNNPDFEPTYKDLAAILDSRKEVRTRA